MTEAAHARWPIQVEILRYKPDRGRFLQTFQVLMEPESTVLDVLEEIQVHQDPTLAYRHSCHHASCGTCGVKVNGRERLCCLSRMDEVARPTTGGYTLRLEPLDNLEVLSDLVVNPTPLYTTMEKAGAPYHRYEEAAGGPVEAFPDCIECSICLSACPVVATSTRYPGPAPLAGSLAALLQAGDGAAAAEALAFADSEHGVWRCHMAFECTEACPMGVRPAEAIMQLRHTLTLPRLGLARRKIPGAAASPTGGSHAEGGIHRDRS